MKMTEKTNDISENEPVKTDAEKPESKKEYAEPLLKPSAELAVAHGKITTSAIQINWGIGYGRAAKIVEKLEQLGVVGCLNSSHSRKTLITKEDFLKMSEDGVFDI